ncbi:MAG: ADP-ribosyl-[dinitrogen reductase] hydrolase, partial [Actinomycetota bacterium]
SRDGSSIRSTSSRATSVGGARATCRRPGGASSGVSRDELLSPSFGADDLVPEIAAVRAGSLREREPPEIEGKGYVVLSLEAALWAFARSGDFRDGALLAVNLGDDADTTGAVYGQLAGAFYGAEAIPADWREKLALRETIEALADVLLELAWD